MFNLNLTESNSFLIGDHFSMITVEMTLLMVIVVITSIYLYDKYRRKHEP